MVFLNLDIMQQISKKRKKQKARRGTRSLIFSMFFLYLLIEIRFRYIFNALLLKKILKSNQMESSRISLREELLFYV